MLLYYDTIADQIIMFSLFFIYMIDLLEHAVYFANFLKMIHLLSRDLKKNICLGKGNFKLQSMF